MGMISQPTEFSSRLFLCLCVSKLLVHNAGLTFLHDNSTCMEAAFTNKGVPHIPVAACYIHNSVSKLPFLWAFFEVRTIPNDLAPRQLILYFFFPYSDKEKQHYPVCSSSTGMRANLQLQTSLMKHLFSEIFTCVGFYCGHIIPFT